MNFQNLGNKVIDDQGNVKTFSSGQDARLYYLDSEGNARKYLLEGEAAGGGGGGAELPENIVNTVNGQTGDVILDIPEVPENIVNTINGQTGDVHIPELPANIVNSVNGQTGDVNINIPEFPELPANIVNSVNGQTGDVNINIPVLPTNIVNSVNGQTGNVYIPEVPENMVYKFNGRTGEIYWPVYWVGKNGESHTIDFSGDYLTGVIQYLNRPVVSLNVKFPSVDILTVQYMVDKYVIVRTAETFAGVTVEFQLPDASSSYPEWITNKEFVMEPNKVYLIGCNFPLATIVELENVK